MNDSVELDVFSPAVEAKYQQALAGLAANTRYTPFDRPGRFAQDLQALVV